MVIDLFRCDITHLGAVSDPARHLEHLVSGRTREHFGGWSALPLVMEGTSDLKDFTGIATRWFARHHGLTNLDRFSHSTHHPQFRRILLNADRAHQ